jgi:hypothetical protein
MPLLSVQIVRYAPGTTTTLPARTATPDTPRSMTGAGVGVACHAMIAGSQCSLAVGFETRFVPCPSGGRRMTARSPFRRVAD